MMPIMYRFLGKLLSPEFWVAAVTLLGILGVVMLLVGFFIESGGLMYAGLGFLAPLVIVAVILVVVVIPVLIIANRRHKQD